MIIKTTQPRLCITYRHPRSQIIAQRMISRNAPSLMIKLCVCQQSTIQFRIMKEANKRFIGWYNIAYNPRNIIPRSQARHFGSLITVQLVRYKLANNFDTLSRCFRNSFVIFVEPIDEWRSLLPSACALTPPRTRPLVQLTRAGARALSVKQRRAKMLIPFHPFREYLQNY